MPLFALRTGSGRFSSIFTSREEVEQFVLTQGIANAEVGLVTFVPICPIRATIEIPWEEGFGSLKDRFEQSGLRSEEPEGDDSSLRAEDQREVGHPPAGQEPKQKRARAVLPRNGKARS